MKRILATLAFFTIACAVARAENPVPFINNPLVPTSVAPGGGAFTLTVNGGGFVSGAVVSADTLWPVLAQVTGRRRSVAWCSLRRCFWGWRFWVRAAARLPRSRHHAAVRRPAPIP